MSNAWNDSPSASHSTARRRLLRAAAGGALAAVTAAAVAPQRKALAQSPLPAKAQAIMDGTAGRALAHATSGAVLQQNLVAVLEGRN